MVVFKKYVFWYRSLVQNQNFLIKRLKKWMSYKIKSLDSFSFKFSPNTNIVIDRFSKNKSSKVFKFWPSTEKFRFSQLGITFFWSRFHDIFSNHICTKSLLSQLSIDTKIMTIAFLVQKILRFKINSTSLTLLWTETWLDYADYDVMIV